MLQIHDKRTNSYLYLSPPHKSKYQRRYRSEFKELIVGQCNTRHYKTVAQEFDVAPYTVLRWCKEAKVPVYKAPEAKELAIATKLKICHQYEKLGVKSEVARTLGVPRSLVLKVLKDAGYDRQRRNNFSYAQKQHILQRVYSQKVPIRQVEEEERVGRTSIYKWAATYGYTKNYKELPFDEQTFPSVLRHQLVRRAISQGNLFKVAAEAKVPPKVLMGWMRDFGQSANL